MSELYTNLQRALSDAIASERYDTAAHICQALDTIVGLEEHAGPSDYPDTVAVPLVGATREETPARDSWICHHHQKATMNTVDGRRVHVQGGERCS